MLVKTSESEIDGEELLEKSKTTQGDLSVNRVIRENDGSRRELTPGKSSEGKELHNQENSAKKKKPSLIRKPTKE